ncbi:hypothetical protein JW721_02590 [Candidatus Micrarchaeota archaeon]|nr:hypothetical protein [Candidatus Micrarchaeota archaeon]
MSTQACVREKNGKLSLSPSFNRSYVHAELQKVLGVKIPPQLSRAVALTCEPQKVGQVARAIKLICESSGAGIESFLKEFRDENLSREISKSPQAFSRICAAAKDEFLGALDTLKQDAVARAFAADPTGVSNAIAEICKAAKANKAEALWALSTTGISGAFAKNPKAISSAFLSIIRDSGAHSSGAFWLLGSKPLSAAFARNPKAISLALSRIALASGKNASDAFSVLERREAALAFAKNPEEIASAFEKISSSLGEAAVDAFLLLSTREVSIEFAKNPSKTAESFARIANSMGGYSGRAFSKLCAQWASAPFSKNIEGISYALEKLGNTRGIALKSAFEVISSRDFINSFCKNPMGMVDSFIEASKISGRKQQLLFSFYFALAHKGFGGREFLEQPQKIVRLAEAFSQTDVYYYLRDAFKRGDRDSIESMLSALDDPHRLFAVYGITPLTDYRHHWKAGRELAREAGVGIEDREVFINFAYAQDKIGREKTIAIHREFGIEYFARYSKEELESLYGQIGENGDDRPLLLVAYNKFDDIQAFYGGAKAREGLAGNGSYYNTIFIEAETEEQFYRKAKELGERYFGISALILGGHGTARDIRMGPGESEDNFIDLSDEKEMRALNGLFVGEPLIILESCLTAKGIGPKISQLWGAELFAPSSHTYLEKLERDEQGKILNVVYKSGGTRFLRGEPLAGQDAQ